MVIDLLSKICQENKISSLGFASPTNIATPLSQAQFVPQNAFKYASSGQPQWRLFIEQSLFYVLSSPKALVQSFKGEGRSLADTLTLWYCMLRLMQLDTLLVLDSLWIAAADLYVPPQDLWPILEWAKKPFIYKADRSIEYTIENAASLMSICLHALLAVVPCSDSDVDLYDISRTRSYGLSTPPGRASPSAIDHFLMYDDAFSNELALRLARRVFAAIPAWRQYQEILGVDVPGYATSSRSPDILDLALAPLNFCDVEAAPSLSFTSEERDLHERRAPTLLIDWARTVMLQEWAGTAEVPTDGPFGGALAIIAAICKSLQLVPRFYYARLIRFRQQTEFDTTW